MKTVICAAVPALLSAIAPARAQAAAPAGCAMPATRNISDVYATLSQRAIAIVEHAAAGGWQRDSELRALVRPDAEFDLGSGDVGGPLGKGPAGAHALAAEMKADSFHYLPWSSIPMVVDPCDEWSVKVAFIDSRASTLADVEFTFRGGVLVSAKGWSQSYVAGQIKPVANR
ncbi:hypothetical protein OMP43_18990 [Sphingomonas sp. CBMAI 2297]|uniref:hypothetical protein n=1 Tax=Sphingomonas sp. CBMAI 2297 TaxID=2991720 RepID=UPI002458A915|nr:hypothetical protein [Sphingomonas sp. CBMAI 2297]MDH4746118.1 hypothetical protein [Sphingomonas sp. CBMAI 2297]